MHPIVLQRRQLLQSICVPAAKAAVAGAFSSWLFVSPTWAKPKTRGLKRLVCVGGALTEIVYALGLEEHLMAVDTTSTYPAVTKNLPSVGYARSLSLEGVLSIKPQILLLTEDAGPPQVLRQITYAGVQIKVFKSDHRYESLIERISAIGLLLGAELRAKKLIKDIDHQWQQYQSHISHSKKLKAMFIMAHSPQQVMVAGQGTSAHAIMNYLNFENTFNVFQGYKPLTPESVITGQPDIILLTEQGLKAQGGLNGILRLPGLLKTPAARHHQIYSREANHLLGFGPRLPSMLYSLAKEIHRIN